MIHTRNLIKVYRSHNVENVALINVNIDIGDNEFVSVTGPSGCGKSSLFNILGLMETPDSGEVFFMNREVSQLPDRQRLLLRRGLIGFVFKDFQLVDELTVFENIELPLIYLDYSKKERRKMVQDVLNRYKISHKYNVYPSHLTGLQKQITALARATVFKPKLLLADEPTGSLDSTAGGEIMELLSGINEDGITIVLFTNSMNIAQRAQRVIQLFDGHVVSEAGHSGL
ncbi:ABC transporter ATP-binding protein [Alkaliflexus imshenetskii]|uniref:ABC transporter ATP-binding protein n=1 Tax=Alkaliflexus imshenetskii TaxID=286730 RepID=UPI0004BA1755|nr:ABC transporter ATP-binding protein [Alkaliflexus imshenetskii]